MAKPGRFERLKTRGMKKNTMNFTVKRVSPVLALLTVGLSSFCLNAGEVRAQPAETATMNPANKKPRARKSALPRRILKGIEEKTGQTLSPEVRAQMAEVAKTRAEAVKAADEKMIADLAKLSGLTVEEIAAILKPGNGARKNAKKDAAPAVAAP